MSMKLGRLLELARRLIMKKFNLYFYFFVESVCLAYQGDYGLINEFGKVLSVSILWNNLRNIGISSSLKV